MIGIDSFEFFKFLESKPQMKIYCSELTKNMLSSWKDESGKTNLAKLDPYLKPLEMNQCTLIYLPSADPKLPDQLSVTLISAGHCPGSTMYLL